MKVKLIDTNILIRYLVEDKDSSQFTNLFNLFVRVEKNDEKIFIDNLVVFESFFTLTSYYKISKKEVSKCLIDVIELPGVEMEDKNLVNYHQASLVALYISRTSPADDRLPHGAFVVL